MPRTRIIIQSRLNSSRLPGKAMLTIAGMPLIELVARRAGRTGHEVVVATSEEHYDGRIAGHLESVGIPVVRGSLDDVLARFVQAAEGLEPDDRLVRLTGDNPVADADLVDELIRAVELSGHTYGRVDVEQVPEGLGAEVFTVAALRQAAATATAAYDREHVTPWLRRALGELLFVPEGCPTDVHAYRATVDTLGDYVRVSALFDGVADPIGTPWLTFMTDLAERVDASGSRVGSVQAAFGRLSRVVLSARAFDDGRDHERPAERSELLRALVADAVDRGVTHVEVGRGDGQSEDALRSSAEPALVKRFGIISRLSPAELPEGADENVRALAVEASVERTFATLGRRGAQLLVFPDPVSAGLGWARACRYRDEGLADGLGVVASTVADLDWARSTPGIVWVEVTAHLAAADTTEVTERLAALAAAGVSLATIHTSRPRPAWATTVIVTDADRGALDRAVAAATTVQAGAEL